VFNHPFVTTEDESGRRFLGAEGSNRQLVKRFLMAAVQRLRGDGEIVIISSKMRLQRWKLDEVADSLGLEMRVMSFLASNFPAYSHEMTNRTGSARSVGRTLEFAVVFKRSS
jgi:hypothetical protein